MSRRLGFISESLMGVFDVDFETRRFSCRLIMKNGDAFGRSRRGPWVFSDLRNVKDILRAERPDINLWRFSDLKVWLRKESHGFARFFLANPHIRSYNPRGTTLQGEGLAFGLRALPVGCNIGEVGTKNAREAGIWDSDWLEANSLTVVRYTKGQRPNFVGELT